MFVCFAAWELGICSKHMDVRNGHINTGDTLEIPYRSPGIWHTHAQTCLATLNITEQLQILI